MRIVPSLGWVIITFGTTFGPIKTMYEGSNLASLAGCGTQPHMHVVFEQKHPNQILDGIMRVAHAHNLGLGCSEQPTWDLPQQAACITTWCDATNTLDALTCHATVAQASGRCLPMQGRCVTPNKPGMPAKWHNICLTPSQPCS